MTHEEAIDTVLDSVRGVGDVKPPLLSREEAETHVSTCPECWEIVRILHEVLLGAEELERTEQRYGCDCIRDQLYLVSTLEIEEVRQRYPQLVQHLRWCQDCRTRLATLMLIERRTVQGTYDADRVGPLWQESTNTEAVHQFEREPAALVQAKPKPAPITILIADDHEVVRRGLRRLLEAEPEFHVLGEAANGLVVVSLVEQLQPNVLVLDLMMPALSGLEILRRVAQRCPQTRVVVLSMHTNEADVIGALRNGALAYVVKGSHAFELGRAVREVAAGRYYLGTPLSARTLEACIQQAAPESTPELYDTLTVRERDVLHLAAEGHTSWEIAKRLGISPRTVETHRSNLMRKLGLETQIELVRYALRRARHAET